MQEQELMSKLDQLELLIDSTQVQPEHNELFCDIMDVYVKYLLQRLETMFINQQINIKKATSLPQSIKPEFFIG